MLQIAAYKLNDMKLHGPPSVGFTLFIFKADPAVFHGNDTIVGDGDLKYIRSQVFDAPLTAADRLAIDIEALFPNL